MSALEVYDVYTDAMRAVAAADIVLLNQLIWAYGALREARRQAPHRGLPWLEDEMDRIHAELERRLKA